jgi:hypothetical protein
LCGGPLKFLRLKKRLAGWCEEVLVGEEKERGGKCGMLREPGEVSIAVLVVRRVWARD